MNRPGPITIVSTRTTDRLTDSRGRVRETPGGPAWYIARALERLEREYRVISGQAVDVEVLDGPYGEEYVIPAIPPIRLPAKLTGRAVILSPIMQGIVPERIPPVDGLLVVDLQGFVRVPGTPSAHPGRKFELSTLLSRADVVKASEPELALLSEESMAALRRTLLIETRGRWGAVVRSGTETTRVAAHYVPVRDTIGAGDTFLAALVDSLTSGQEPVTATTAAARFTEAVLRERQNDPEKDDSGPGN